MAAAMRHEKACATAHGYGLTPIQVVGCTYSDEEYKENMRKGNYGWYAKLFDPDGTDVAHTIHPLSYVSLMCDACQASDKKLSECNHRDDEHPPWNHARNLRDEDRAAASGGDAATPTPSAPTTPWTWYASNLASQISPDFSNVQRTLLQQVYNIRDTWNDMLSTRDWGLFIDVLGDAVGCSNEVPQWNVAYTMLWKDTTTLRLVECFRMSRAVVDRTLQRSRPAYDMSDSELEAPCPDDVVTVCSLDPRFYTNYLFHTEYLPMDSFVRQVDRVAHVTLLACALAYGSSTGEVDLLRKLLRVASRVTRRVTRDLDVSRVRVEALVCSLAFRLCASEPCMRLLLQFRAPLLLDEQDGLLKEAYRWHDECAPYLSPPDPTPVTDPVPDDDDDHGFEAPMDFIENRALPKKFQQSIRRFRATRVALVDIVRHVTSSVLCTDVIPTVVDFLPGPPVLDWMGKRSRVDVFKAMLQRMDANLNMTAHTIVS